MLVRPYESKIPDAFDAVVAACTAAFTGADPKVFVRDGPWTGGEAGGAYVQDLVIGWYGFYPGYQYPSRSLSEEMGEAVITGTNTQAGWGPSQEEEFTFGCASIVAVGHQPSTGEWSKLRRMAYGNIAAASRYLADPEAGQLYLNGTTERLTIAASNAAHQVARSRGLLCVVTFSIEGCTVSQQLQVKRKRPRRCVNTVIRGLTAVTLGVCGAMDDCAIKVCSGCQEPKDRDRDFHRNRSKLDGRANECKSCAHDRNVQPGRAADLLDYSARHKAGNKDLVRERQRGYPRNKANDSVRQARHIAKLKAKVFEHYGTVCACCGTGDDLSIDHMDGRGAEHRSELFGRSSGTPQIYRWLIKAGFPGGFQTLCRPCNSSKARTGRCRLLHSIGCPSCGHHLSREDILAAAAKLLLSR